MLTYAQSDDDSAEASAQKTTAKRPKAAGVRDKATGGDGSVAVSSVRSTEKTCPRKVPMRIEGEIKRPWDRADVSQLFGFMELVKWTLSDDGTRRACLIFTPPRPMNKIYSMVAKLKGTNYDKWEDFYMPRGKERVGLGEKTLVDSKNDRASTANVLTGLSAAEHWTTAGLTVVNKFHENTKTGKGAPTVRELVNANPESGLNQKKVNSPV